VHYVRCMVFKQGLFDNRVLDFSDRLTIVFGKNSSGKSLLVRGLVDALWGKFSNKKLLGEDARKNLHMDVLFSLSQNGYYRINTLGEIDYKIFYIHGNDEYVVYSEPPLHAAEGAGLCGFISTIQSRTLQQFLTKIDYDTFVHSSFIPSSADMTRDAHIDYSVLKRIIMDDHTGFYNHYTNLRKSFQDGGTMDSSTAILKYEDQRRELGKKILLIDISGSRHEKLNREKNNIQEEIDELNGSLSSLNSQKEILSKIIQNLTKVEELKNEFENIKEEIQREQQKIKSITDIKNEIDALFPQFINIDINDNTNLDKLQEVFNDIRSLNERIDDYYFIKKRRLKRFLKISTAIIAGALSSAAFIIAKNDFAFQTDLSVWTGILISAAASVAAYSLYILVSSRTRILKQLEEEKKQFKGKIRLLMEESRVEFEDYKLTEIYELLLQYFEDYINYTERKKDIDRIQSSLKEDEYMAKIQRKLDTLKSEEEQIKSEIHSSIGTLNIVGDMEHETTRIEELMQNIDMEMALIREKIETKEQILHKIDEEFIQASSNSDQMNALIEEKNALEKIMKKWKINQNSLQFITRILTRAVERNEEKQLKKLIDAALDKFNHLTGNQYITRIDDGVLMQMITGAPPSEELPQPLVHALMISIKISLSEFITDGSAGVPLLIDEPFQFMDDERSSRFRDLVSYVSNKRQVIIFTHHSDKRNWGNFIEL